MISFLVKFFSIVFCFSSLVCLIFSQGKYKNDPSILKDKTGYKLRVGDRINVSVSGEPDATAGIYIDNNGIARIPFIGDQKVTGVSSRKLEQILAAEYKRQLIYKNPIIKVSILDYAERVVFLSGSVIKKGPYVFPPEVEAMNIVEVIARAGGFSDIARKSKVFVTRTFYDKFDKIIDTKTYEVNVEALSLGALNLGSSKRFWIYPGDRIEVPERLI